MANTREIRRRITSVGNTRQITRAMEMVAATKMRKAQQAVVRSRDYAERAENLFTMVAGSGEPLDAPLLERRPIKKIGVVVVGTDKGLAGALNTNLLRHVAAEAEVIGKGKQVEVIAVGRKIEQGARARQLSVGQNFTDFADSPQYEEIVKVAELVRDSFTGGKYDAIYLAYPKYISTLRNEPTMTQILPAVLPESQADTGVHAVTVFEPSPEAVLEELLPKIVEVRLWQALLETKASEFSSKMVAMQNATKNAGELLDELTFSFNQARQAAITTEIAEIAAAAELA
jgi:F-type H+-transporting ATPase subunit gamma